MPKKIMILGANGFIGSALTAAILKNRDWEVFGMDLSDHKLGELTASPRFTQARTIGRLASKSSSNTRSGSLT